MTSSKSDFTLVIRSPGRQSDEEWDTVEPQIWNFWSEAAMKLSKHTYAHEGCEIEVFIDWAPLVPCLKRRYDIVLPLRTGKRPRADWFDELDQPLTLKASCNITGTNRLSGYAWYAEFFLEYFLYDVFAIANLACPSSAEFLNIEIPTKDTVRPPRLGLSALLFDEWLVESIDGKFPRAKTIDLQTTIDWYYKVNPCVTQKGENGTQRALFSMYQLCKSDGHIDTIIWLFNALEALLTTKAGENFSGLVRRIALLLELSESEKRRLSKKLRELYDLRSSFVHGGYSVPHPLHRELVDQRIEEDYMRILSSSIYGFSILCSLFQSLIERQIPVVSFEEKIVIST